MTIGEEIRRVRKELHMTQAELAKKCGLNRNTIYSYEKEFVVPSVQTLVEIARALGLEDYHFLKFEFKKEKEAMTAIRSGDVNKINELIQSPEYKNANPILEFAMKNMPDNEQDLKIFYAQTLLTDYYKLNNLGQEEARKRVQELTEIPKYQKDNEEKE